MVKLLNVYSASGVSLPERRFMFRWFSLGIAFHLVMAWFSLGFYYFDEHFQILEFGAYKAGLMSASHLKWEYYAQIRPAFQPYIAYCIIKILEGMHRYDPYCVATILRFLSATLGWASSLLITIVGLSYISNAWLRKFFVIITCVLAPLIFVHVRFSGEGWSGSLVFAGMAISLLLIQKTKQQVKNESFAPFLFSGFLMGLAYVCRFQTCIIIAVFFLWLILMTKLSFKKLFWIGSGVILAVLAGVILDRLFYGEWVNTAYNYFYYNIILGIAAQFGKQPWWWYIKGVLDNGLFYLEFPMIILVIISFFTKWKNPFVWVSAIFLIVHCAISHKEFRFLFPLIDTLPLLFILGLSSLFSFFNSRNHIYKTVVIVIAPIFILLNVASVLSSCISPACSYLYAMQYIYRNHQEPIDVVISDKYVSTLTLGALKMNFYDHPETNYIFLNIKNIDSVVEFAKNNNHPILMMEWTQGFDPERSWGHLSPYLSSEYMTYPHWLKIVNFNHWADRTSCWQVYKIKV